MDAPERVRTVLIVDDDRESVESMTAALSSKGIQTQSALELEDVMETLNTSGIDAIVIDPASARDAGWLILTEIRGDDQFLSIPILVITVKDKPLMRTIAFDRGAQQFMRKPADKDEFTTRIENLISYSQKLRAHAMAGNSPRKITAYKGTQSLLLKLEDVVYFSAKNKYTYAHTHTDRYLVNKTLLELINLFDDKGCVRPHRSYLVPINKVFGITKVDDKQHKLILETKEMVPISRRQLSHVRETLGV